MTAGSWTGPMTLSRRHSARSAPSEPDIGRARATYTGTGRRAVVGITLAVALLGAACGQPLVSHVIGGSFVLSDPGVTYTAVSCSGTGGYSDIRVGLGVIARDGAGKVLATSSLSYDAVESSRDRCAYVFTLSVPDSDFYEIEVGNRGKLTYSKVDLEARSWLVSATLGD